MEYDRSENWFSIWKQDSQDIINTMIRNIASDLEGGYDPLGNSITNSINELVKYKSKHESEMKMLQTSKMTWERINKWCWFELVKRGAIE